MPQAGLCFEMPKGAYKILIRLKSILCLQKHELIFHSFLIFQLLTIINMGRPY